METPSSNDPQWERQLLEKIAFSTLLEQRAKRRWGIFFKLSILLYLIAVLVLVVDWGDSEKLAD
ncbi:MAG: S49 family peptidase, partial [Deltaproteobacteria bacterium]|nr:S49 family peptidase [Deltaproteobacteria bacterium]